MDVRQQQDKQQRLRRLLQAWAGAAAGCTDIARAAGHSSRQLLLQHNTATATAVAPASAGATAAAAAGAHDTGGSRQLLAAAVLQHNNATATAASAAATAHVPATMQTEQQQQQQQQQQEQLLPQPPGTSVATGLLGLSAAESLQAGSSSVAVPARWMPM
jgi:hypothetical protein